MPLTVVSPVELQKLPGGHEEHCDSLSSPGTAEYDPGGHPTATVDFVTQYEPAGHTVNVAVVVPELQVNPAGQSEHSVEAVRLVESEYVPAGHAVCLGLTVPASQ